ncbi:hydrolase [Peribacillus alkalitolerans]|uniref:hydrolase n=1 Tax=Peribacillus alkalitolerans TaxID=1550385 RepID=UPI0013D24832|nr:hydrolase [Peribacillus alkalitolerans]
MMQRTFLMDSQWNIVYYPEKPNGFSVFLIGDREHYVEEKNSFWDQHPSRIKLIESMKNQGYTAFSSHLYGKHWGSERAFQLSKQLYYMIMKSEILNDKIHIYTEGMGAILALRIMKEWPEKVRSAVFINPCLSLETKLVNEKEKKFFYKRFLRELENAHGAQDSERSRILDENSTFEYKTSIPIKVIHILGHQGDDQSHLYKNIKPDKESGAVVELQYLFAEQRFKLARQAVSFFQQFEQEL